MTHPTGSVGAVDWLLGILGNFGNQTVPRWPNWLTVGVQAQFHNFASLQALPLRANRFQAVDSDDHLMRRTSVHVILLWLSAALNQAADTTDWNEFWTLGNCSVQECLVPISEVSFCIATERDACNCYTTNLCVCTNQTFLDQVGECIACSCPDEAVNDYMQYKSVCISYGGYALSASENVFTSCYTNGGL
jgi:hypothetical protein